MIFTQKIMKRALIKSLLFFIHIIGTCSVFSAEKNDFVYKNFWKGSFISGHIGGAWGRSDMKTDVGVFSDESYFVSTANIDSVNQSGSSPLKSNAFVGGVGISNNWVFHSIVYGLALDFSSFHIQGASNQVDVDYPTTQGVTYSLQTSVESNFLFTARGRLGIAPVNWPFIYLTGGLALTKLYVANNFGDRLNILNVGGASNNSVRSGWTLGSGVEVPLATNWILFSEYLYVDFGSFSVQSAISAINSGFDGERVSSPFITSSRLNANIFRVGLNYKFS
jgi:opacity protein-like surface antigen